MAAHQQAQPRNPQPKQENNFGSLKLPSGTKWLEDWILALNDKQKKEEEKAEKQNESVRMYEGQSEG